LSTHLAWIYCGLVFIAVTGVLQIAATHNNLKGLSFFNNKLAAYIFAALTIGFAMVIFFIWNYHFATGIIEGSQQAGYFALTTGIAVVFTILVAGIINSSSLTVPAARQNGLASLRKSTWFSLIRQKLASKNS
jgi:hypothetical protein